MTSSLNRRNFFKLAGAAASGVLLPPALDAARVALAKPYSPPEEVPLKPPFIDYQPARVLASSVAVYSSLDPNNRKVLRSVRRDQTIDVAGEFVGPGPGRNQTWYGTRDGFVYSAWLQRMEPYRTPRIVADVGEWGMWIETIVASAPAYTQPDESSPFQYWYNYGTTYHVTETYTDATGRVWYNTVDEYASKDDNIGPTNHWVPAIFFRPIEQDEFKAINPHTPDKRIAIDLGAQQLTCYEGDKVVLTSRVASGAAFTIGEGMVDFSTPRGEFSAILKMPSRHMRAPEAERGSNAWFDLPGVPWNTFFTYEGIAIHGTYWHNDYGLPRSHGCVNVPIEVAKYVYFWTNPVAPYENDFVQGDVPEVTATQIVVV
jgi:lipoprotein-anchoring transpeptidase ErfK/SrfK